MRLPKATLRKSGRMMMTATVEHQVSINDFTDALAFHHIYFKQSIEEVKTRSKAYEMLLRLLKERGESWITEEIDQEILQLAEAKAKELFADLVDPA